MGMAGTFACVPIGCRCSRESPGASDEPSSSTVSKQRIVSVTPNTTEAVFALGAGSRLVGRSRYCDFPPEVEKLPSVGGYVDPSFETILGLRPDLVIGARGPSGRSMVEKLEARGIECYFPSTESVQEVFSMIEGLAQRLGTTKEGNALAQSIRARLSQVHSVVADSIPPRVLLVFGQSPVSVAGPGSFPNEMLVLAGCKNAVEQGTRYPTVGFEAIIALDPDLVFDATMAGNQKARAINSEHAGWASVRAVREGRVKRIDSDTILRPGPRLAEGVATLARSAHPDIPAIQIP